MPLLAPEAACHPEDLFQVLSSPARHWWVFQTRPRAEKACVRVLRKLHASYFLPQYTHSWRKNGRGFSSALPLFPGYVFVCGADSARTAAFATNQVVREVVVPDQVQLDRELAAVSRLLGGGALRPEDGIAKGTRVTVVEGIYAGVEGRVMEAADHETLRIAVEVTLLGRGVSVAVDRWMIKVLEPTHV